MSYMLSGFVQDFEKQIYGVFNDYSMSKMKIFKEF